MKFWPQLPVAGIVVAAWAAIPGGGLAQAEPPAAPLDRGHEIYLRQCA